MLAKCGVQVVMSDLFGVAGTELLDRLDLPAPYAARIASLRRLIDDLDFTRFASAPKLTCWAGLTPKHHESDTHVHRGSITKQGSRLVRWAAIESVKAITARSPAGVLRERVADRRGRNIGAVAAARRQLEFVFYGLRDGHVRALEHRPRVA